jgi:hypothetical protein
LRVINLEDYLKAELARVSFDRPRRRWRRIAAALLLATLLVLVAATTLHGPAWAAGVPAALALLAAAFWIFYEWRHHNLDALRGQLRAGLRGQRRMVKLLAPLDDNYYLINNLKLPGRADDVDHLLVGPNGIFALETKNHRGRIFAENGQWYQAKLSRNGRPQPKNPIRDPVQQLKRNVDYLRTCINRTDPELSRRTRLWIEGAVVFVNPAASIDLPPAVERQLSFPVLRARDLPGYVLEQVPRRPFSKQDVRAIVDMMSHLASPTAGPTGC